LLKCLSPERDRTVDIQVNSLTL